VAIDDPNNSSSQGLIDAFRLHHNAELKVSKSGTGTGTVTESAGSPSGIVCGSICTETVDVSGIAFLALHAAPDAGSRLAGWSGCDFVTPAGDCEVFLESLSNVTATFDALTGPPPPPGTYTLSVVYHPEEAGQSGAVTSTPAAINCPSGSCSASFSASTAVTLTATPAAGSYFDYWTGCDSQAGGTCYVTMNQARSVTAYFGYP
jgi:Divergent InlB B-repeat domain